MSKPGHRYLDGHAWTTGDGEYAFEVLSSKWSERHGGRWLYRVRRTWNRKVSEINLPHAAIMHLENLGAEDTQGDTES